ncbi:putative lipoprotein [Vibrio cholerae]|nr:putative lipoprotein [Vibrio cholerae]
MLKWLRVLLLCTLLVGCATKFVYHNLDWFVIDYAEDFVDLNKQQKTLIKQTMPSLQSWHRAQELPDYLAMMDELSALSLREVTVEQVAQYQEKMRLYYQRLVIKLLPDVSRLAATLSEEQTEQFMQAFIKRHDKFAKKFIKMDERELRDFYQERIKDRLEDWLGPLNKSQQELVKVWSNNIQPTANDWIGFQTTMREQVRTLLQQRTQPEAFQAQLESLLLNPEQHYGMILKAKLSYNRELGQRYVVQILQSSSDKQQQHWRDELADWRERVSDLLIE